MAKKTIQEKAGGRRLRAGRAMKYIYFIFVQFTNSENEDTENSKGTGHVTELIRERLKFGIIKT